MGARLPDGRGSPPLWAADVAAKLNALFAVALLAWTVQAFATAGLVIGLMSLIKPTYALAIYALATPAALAGCRFRRWQAAALGALLLLPALYAAVADGRDI